MRFRMHKFKHKHEPSSEENKEALPNAAPTREREQLTAEEPPLRKRVNQ